VLFPIAQITTLNKMLGLARLEATGGATQLEWPQEVGNLFEVGSGSVYLVNKIFHADDAILTQRIFDYFVVRELIPN
jgi:hypothetical protein